MTPKEQADRESALGYIAACEGDHRRFMDLRPFSLSEATAPVVIERLSSLHQINELWLSLSGRLPHNLAQLAGLGSLKKLSISGGDQLTELQPLAAFSGLEELQLYLCRNATNLTPLASLRCLKTLNLHNCHRITDLAPIAKLASLSSLKLNACLILTDLSPLAKLNVLRQLSLARCDDVTDLTPLSALTALETLDLSLCQKVTNLHPLVDLIALKSLNLWQCFGISSISAIRSVLPRLEHLDLGAVPISDLPKELFAGPTKDLLVRLRAHYADLAVGEAADAEIKVVLLGNGRVGKTQLSRSLRCLPYNDRIPTTHGIQLDSTGLPLDTYTEPIRLNLWDFGGQDFYLGTHTLFIRGRSVHLLLWNPQNDTRSNVISEGIAADKPLVYWLDYLRAFAGTGSPVRVTAPVIVIQSKCDRGQGAVAMPPTGDTSDFDFIHIEQVSVKDGLYIEDLRTALRKAIRYALNLQKPDTIGIGRVRVRNRLRAMLETGSVRLLTHEQFGAVCAEEGGISNREALLQYLHQSGVVFYQRGLFGDEIILDQNWALRGIYALFDPNASLPLLKAQGGRFTRRHLEILAWSDKTRDEQELFLNMMQFCRICFRVRKLRDGEWEYLAPDLLPSWLETKELVLVAPLETIPTNVEAEALFPHLHEGILRNYIGWIGEHASGSANYWRYGFAVHEEATKTTVLMQSTWNEGGQGIDPGSLAFKAWGVGSKKLLRFLLSELTKLPIGASPPVVRFKNASGTWTDALLEESEQPPPAELVFSPVGNGTNQPREIYLSYAWGDDKSEAGKRRSEIADLVETCAQEEGWIVRRDRTEIAAGCSIAEFMGRITRGNRVLIVLSRRYLERERCMAELYGIYLDAKSNEEEFRNRIVPVVLDDANIGSVAGRIAVAKYWEAEVAKIEPDWRYLGLRDYGVYRSMKDWVLKVVDILSYISDTRVPWGFEDIKAGDSKLLKELLARR